MRLVVNGRGLDVPVDPRRSLLFVLRNELDLTGAKYGCGEGECGACTVLVDGIARRSCITPVSAVEGKEITTIEGLEKDGRLHPVQQAFLDADAMQCGYCTPGMILSVIALLRKKSTPSDAEIIWALEGNLCRCGTYGRIVDAIHRVTHSVAPADEQAQHA